MRLPLEEVREVLAASEALAATAEAAGLRASPPLRPALQQLCKAWLDALHARSMQQLNCGPSPPSPCLRCVRSNNAASRRLDGQPARLVPSRTTCCSGGRGGGGGGILPLEHLS